MIRIKQKSLIVALVSSLIISLVLVLTLVGYLIYIELRANELQRVYQEALAKINAKGYSRYMEVSALTAVIAGSGPLSGKPVIEGDIKNNGHRPVTNLLIKVKFLDRDNAVIYEVIFHPQEPALGAAKLTQVNIPYLTDPAKFVLKSGGVLSFKRILTGCPKEIVGTLRERKGFARNAGRWSGALGSEIISLDF